MPPPDGGDRTSVPIDGDGDADGKANSACGHAGNPLWRAGTAPRRRPSVIRVSRPLSRRAASALGSTRQVLRVLVGGTSIGTYNTGNETTNNNTNFDRGIKSFPVPTGTTGAVSFRLEFGAAGDHEDIHLYSPSITCA